MPLFLALVLVPIIEIGLFIEVGGAIGLWPTLGIVVLTAAIGTYLLRTQGIGVLAELQRKLERGEDPSGTLANGAMILISGIVLLTPGFFTDALGFLLLMPPVRAWLIRAAAHRILFRGVHVQGHFHASAGTRDPAAGPARTPPPGHGQTIDGEFTRVDDEPGNGADTGQTAGPRAVPPQDRADLP